MPCKKLIFMFFAIQIALTSQGKTYRITPTDNFETTVKQLKAGDSLVLRNGAWKDAQLLFTGNGTADRPITLTVEEKGKVTLEGNSCIRLSGEYLNVSGLVFINGYTPTGTVIEMRTGSQKPANNCTLSECVIYHYNQPDKSQKDAWVSVYGKNNRIERCYFAGKSNQGTMFIIWPDGEQNNRNHHHLYRNYFGARPPLGANGGETIRIGTSTVSQDVSASIVEENYFERCNGEIEIISVKSCENRIINNTFFECKGTLTLRHGHRNEVAGNFFHGNRAPGTGGIRIINEGHKVYNNFLYQLTGDNFYSALSIMNAIENTPLNGYHQVKDVAVSNNTIVDCLSPLAFCVGKGERERDVRPVNTQVINNLVVCPSVDKLIREYDNTDGIALRNNLMISSNGLERGKGCVAGNPIPFVWGNDIQAVMSNTKAEPVPFITTGITHCKPSGSLRIGAFQGCQTPPLATAETAGPSWFKASLKSALPQQTAGRIIAVAPGADNLYQAIRKARPNDILELSEGEYLNTKRTAIDNRITIRAKAGCTQRPIIRTRQESNTAALFELKEKSRLLLQGVELDGQASSDKPTKYAIITAKDSPREFSLYMENCLIDNFASVDNGGAVYQAYPGAFADSIVVTNSTFRNCFRGFALNAEKEEKGKYNAEYVIFDNTLFESIAQYPIDYQRLGIDDSTLGGSLRISNCVFSNVNPNDGKYCLPQKGIKNIRIVNSIFANSSAKGPIQLTLPEHYFGYNVISDCGKMGKSAARQENNIEQTVRFKKGTVELDNNSPLRKAGQGGTTIGLK